MFGLGNSDDDERLWNLTVFKIYATDKEISDAATGIGCVVFIIAVVAIVFAIARGCSNQGGEREVEHSPRAELYSGHNQ